MNDAITDDATNKTPLTPTKKTTSGKKETSLNKEGGEENTNNQNSTNSYRLVNRKALHFPNPVYICDGYGKVVLHIEVSNLGKVIQATLNKNSSTTNNECLIESAIKYAEKARFNTDAKKPVQMGSITYIFPGQR